MTLEEAQKLAMISLTIHDGCPGCVASFTDELNKAFPEFEWVWSSDDNGGPGVITVEYAKR